MAKIIPNVPSTLFELFFEGEKNSFADLNREISEAEAILSDQADQIDDRRNFSLSRVFRRHSYFELRVGVGLIRVNTFLPSKKCLPFTVLRLLRS